MAKDQLEFRLTVRDDGTIAVERFVSSVQRGGKRVKQSASIMGRAFGAVNRKLTEGFKRLGGRIANLPRSILNVRNALVGLGAGLVIRNIIRTFVDFQRVMNRVGAITGAVGEEFAALESTARRLGETTVFSATQAAEAMDLLARAGLEANEIIEATPKVLDVAAAGQLELADATRIVLGVLKGLGIEISDLTEANDILVKTFTSANVTLIDLGESLKFVGPIARAMGQTLTDVSAILGILGDASIRGSLAGTSLRRAFAALINPTREAQKVLKRLDISIADSAGNVRPLIDILEDLRDAQKRLGLTSIEAGKQIFQLFGQRAATAIIALVKRIPQLRELQRTLSDAGGTAQRVAERQLEGLVGALVRMESAIEGAKISIGEELAPTIEQIAVGITEFARDVSAAIKGIRAFNEELDRTGATPFGDVVVAFIPSLQTLVTAFFTVRKVMFLLQIGFAKVVKGILQAFNVLNAGIRLVGLQINSFERFITTVFLTLSNFISQTTGDFLEDIIALVRGIANLLAKVPFGDELADPLIAGADAAEVYQKALSIGLDVQKKVAEVTARQNKELAELKEFTDEVTTSIKKQTETISDLTTGLERLVVQENNVNTALQKGLDAAKKARMEQEILLGLRKQEAAFAEQIAEMAVVTPGPEAIAAPRVQAFNLVDILVPPETSEQLLTRTREVLDELLPQIRQRIIAEEQLLAQQQNLTRDQTLERVRQRAMESIAIAEAEALRREQLEKFKGLVAQKTVQLLALAEQQGFISSKAAAIGQAVINTALAITKVISQLGVFAGPAVALVAAVGAAQIAAIASASPGGGGGAFGGGVAGGAAPGAAPAEEAAAPAAPSQQVSIVVQGFIGNEAELASQIGRVFREAVGDSVDFGVEVQT